MIRIRTLHEHLSGRVTGPTLLGKRATSAKRRARTLLNAVHACVYAAGAVTLLTLGYILFRVGFGV